MESGHEPGSVRIIGGRFRGRRLKYSGDLRTRPMKDRVREAVFNLLADDARGKLAIDLFAGTGVLALEALSRGAAGAICIEQHFPTADLIRQNCTALGAEDMVEVVPGNVFIWVRRLAEGKLPPGKLTVDARWPPALPSGQNNISQLSAVPASDGAALVPWLVFCSPPYAFYHERRDEMVQMLTRLVAMAPVESVFVVETEGRGDFDSLPQAGPWDIRLYPPAAVGIARKPP